MKTKHRINMRHEPKHVWNGGIVPHARWVVAPLFFQQERNKEKTQKWIQLELFPSEREEGPSS